MSIFNNEVNISLQRDSLKKNYNIYDNIKLHPTLDSQDTVFLFSFLMYKMLSCVFSFYLLSCFFSRGKSIWGVEGIIEIDRA